MKIEEIYNQYYKTVYIVIDQILKNKMDTEDVVHDAFIAINQNLHTIKDPKAISGWIKRIAINEALMFKRNQSKNIISITDLLDKAMLKYDAKTEINNDGQNNYRLEMYSSSREQHIEIDYNVLKGIINKMPKQYQNVLVLKSEGYKHSEISKQLGIQIGTTKSTLTRAKRYLSVRIPKPYNVYLKHEKNKINK